MKSKTSLPASLPQILTTSLIAALSGLALTFLCTLFLSILIENAAVPESAAVYAFLTVIPGAFLSGFFTARCAGRQMLAYGILGGIVFFVLLLLLSLLLLPDLAFQHRMIPTLACTAAASILGAVLAPRK